MDYGTELQRYRHEARRLRDQDSGDHALRMVLALDRAIRRAASWLLALGDPGASHAPSAQDTGRTPCR